jgi:hypothetical protein
MRKLILVAAIAGVLFGLATNPNRASAMTIAAPSGLAAAAAEVKTVETVWCNWPGCGGRYWGTRPYYWGAYWGTRPYYYGGWYQPDPYYGYYGYPAWYRPYPYYYGWGWRRWWW